MLAGQPQIAAPSVVLVGADDGVDPPVDDLRAELALDQFTDLIEVRVLPGCGRNPPQEAPDLFEAALHLVL